MITKTFKGKFLVRRSALSNKEPVVIICGVFKTNFDSNILNDDDEMWVAELEVKEGGLRFHNRVSTRQFSPEDFLEGEHQAPSYWQNKDQLDLFNPF